MFQNLASALPVPMVSAAQQMHHCVDRDTAGLAPGSSICRQPRLPRLHPTHCSLCTTSPCPGHPCALLRLPEGKIPSTSDLFPPNPQGPPGLHSHPECIGGGMQTTLVALMKTSHRYQAASFHSRSGVLGDPCVVMQGPAQDRSSGQSHTHTFQSCLTLEKVWTPGLAGSL